MNCNIHENRKNSKIDVQDLSLLEYKLLKIRTKIKDFNTVQNVSKYHKPQLVTEFSNYYRGCVDPLRNHKNAVRTSLHEITVTAGFVKQAFDNKNVLTITNCYNKNYKC